MVKFQVIGKRTWKFICLCISVVSLEIISLNSLVLFLDEALRQLILQVFCCIQLSHWRLKGKGMRRGGEQILFSHASWWIHSSRLALPIGLWWSLQLLLCCERLVGHIGIWALKLLGMEINLVFESEEDIDQEVWKIKLEGDLSCSFKRLPDHFGI